MSSDMPWPVGGDSAALKRQLAAELTGAVFRAEKRLGRAIDRVELARRLNVSPSSLYAYLNGTTLVGVAVLDDLLAVLGVTGPQAGRLGTLRDAADTARRLRSGPDRSTVRPWTPAPLPRQLPASNPQFVGREAEINQLDTLRATGDGVTTGRVPAQPVTVVTIEGSAGVGKTTLALHWARRGRAYFPDGQLHVNLRGFDAGGPMPPGEALYGFLQALGVAPDAIPVREPVASALLRSLLADRRVLVLLDNARSAEQVRPLLPSSPGSLAIVTSRHRLDSLVVREGARRITLDVMPRYAARALLERQIGADRLAREPRAADELVDLCARLPLALSVAAARVAVAPGGSVGLFVTELRQARARLDVLRLQDADVDLRTVFERSYALLPPAAARLFRLLGCYPGPDIGAAACAALIGTRTTPGALLDTLTATHLVQQCAPGRFALHDLLRLYAKELADGGPVDEGDAATRRLLRHYLHVARLADHRLDPSRGSEPPSQEQFGTVPTIGDHIEAMAWFDAELATLQAAIGMAAASDGLEPFAWELAQACTVYLRRSGRRLQRALVHGLAQEAAARAGNRAAWAVATRCLADAVSRLDRSPEALGLLSAVLRECRRLRDDEGVREARLSLVRVHASCGDHLRALPHARLALAMAERTADPVALADGLTAVAQQQERLGHHSVALEHGRRALELYERLGHLDGQAAILLNTGRAQHGSGSFGEAVSSYERSLALDRALGDRYREAHALDHLADAHAALGHPRRARELRLEALAVLVTLGHPDATAVRAKLRRMPAG